MKLLIITAITAMLLLNCGYFKKEKEAEPEVVPPAQPPAQNWLDDLRDYKAELLNEMMHLQTVENKGWITTDCDAWIWVAKAVIAGLTDVNILASEYTATPGKFGRRPPMPRWCYQSGQNYGSDSTWSRDMAIAGLIPYSLFTGDIQPLKRHAKYGERKNWIMGDPSDSDRVIYSPQIINTVYKTLGKNVQWITVYSSGLTDYQAHLQMYNILIRAEIERELPTVAIDRIREHADREPNNAFYSYLRHRFDDGGYSAVARSLIDGTADKPTYVRCDGQTGCWLAERAFVAELVLREYEQKDL